MLMIVISYDDSKLPIKTVSKISVLLNTQASFFLLCITVSSIITTLHATIENISTIVKNDASSCLIFYLLLHSYNFYFVLLYRQHISNVCVYSKHLGGPFERIYNFIHTTNMQMRSRHYVYQ